MPESATAPPAIDPAQHLGLLISEVNRLAPRFPELGQDLVGIAYLGMLDAAKRFPAESVHQFSTYAVNNIRWAVCRAAKKWRRHSHQPLPQSEDGGTLEPPAPSGHDPFLADDLAHLLKTLTEVERRIITWRFGLEGAGEMSTEVIALKMGLSPQRVNYLISRALGRMKRAGQASAWPAPRCQG